MDCTKFKRVSRTRRCPICDRPDWCLVCGPEHDPTAAICARIESNKRCGDAGWLHRLRDSDNWTRRRTFTVSTPQAAPIDFGRLAKSYAESLSFHRIHELGHAIGISTNSLHRLGVGWWQDRQAFTFPMRSPTGGVVGIRLRLTHGHKRSVRGGREGLFVPEGLQLNQPLFITEGPTDTAALLDLGFTAIGRPSCTGGTRHIIDFCIVNKVETTAVIVADADEPGQKGASRLASALRAYVGEIRVLTPPGFANDVRDWVRMYGATHATVAEAVEAAPIQKMKLVVRRGGRAHA